jgi:hypothetical protein
MKIDNNIGNDVNWKEQVILCEIYFRSCGEDDICVFSVQFIQGK